MAGYPGRLSNLVPGERRLFAGDPNQPTAAENVEAYNSFVAGSGTYTLTGSTLTLNAVLHKNPNEMEQKCRGPVVTSLMGGTQADEKEVRCA